MRLRRASSAVTKPAISTRPASGRFSTTAVRTPISCTRSGVMCTVVRPGTSPVPVAPAEAAAIPPDGMGSSVMPQIGHSPGRSEV